MSSEKTSSNQANIRPDLKKLMSNREVVQEINRHQWIESEKAGYDIGFGKACEDWMGKFADAWISYHLPDSKEKTQKSSSQKGSTVKKRRTK